MEAAARPAESSKRAGWCLAAAALVPFGAALAFHATDPLPQPGGPPVPRPALVFEQYLVNLREIPPMQEATARFAFTNTARGPVTITAVDPSCGCLKPRLDKRTFAPGESGEFFARIQTATERPGPKEYSIAVRYTDPEPRETKLIFQVMLPERKVLVEPRGLIFYQFGTTPPAAREIAVTDYRGRSLEIVRVETSTPLVTAEIGSSDRDAEGHHRTRVSVTLADEIPEGLHRGLVTIHTSDADFARLHVPVMIERRVNGGRMAESL